jgi:hypothetical protein
MTKTTYRAQPIGFVGLVGVLILSATACGKSKQRALDEEKCSRGFFDVCMALAAQEKDPKKADPFYRNACRMSVLEACLKAIGDDPVAVCRGEGAFLCSNTLDIYHREKRTADADALLTRLCEGGDSSACTRRDAAYWNQCRGGDSTGCEALKAACAKGSAVTCRSLNGYYRRRCTEGEWADCIEARQTGHAGCNAGDEKTCQALEAQMQGDCRKGEVGACEEHRNFSVEACSRGYTWACGELENADRHACARLDVAACSRLDNACRTGARSDCESLDGILFRVCEQEPAVCGILFERCEALKADNLCEAAISGYDTGCRKGQGKQEACAGLVAMCNRGNKNACSVANLKILN